MNTVELIKKLRSKGVPDSFYNINGTGEIDQRMCMEYVHDKWLVYFSERGRKFDIESFDTEEQACVEIYSRLVE